MNPPLSGTLGRLRTLDPCWHAQVGPPQGDAWYRLDRIGEDGHLPDLIDALAAGNEGQRDVAGSLLGSALAAAMLTVPVVSLVAERRMPSLSGALWAHRHPDDWFDRVAFESPGMFVLPHDPDAGHPDAIVLPDEAAIISRFTARAMTIVAPVLDGIGVLVPYGRRRLWAGIADELAAAAMWGSRTTGADPRRTWRMAMQLVAEMAMWSPHVRTLPRPFPVAWSGGQTLFPVKTACCLYYKTQGEPPDARAEGYCSTCPLRDDNSRRDRLVRYLEQLEDA